MATGAPVLLFGAVPCLDIRPIGQAGPACMAELARHGKAGPAVDLSHMDLRLTPAAKTQFENLSSLIGTFLDSAGYVYTEDER